MPYLLEKLYADLCGLFMFRYQLNEGRIRNLNRLHREMKIYFSEYKDAFGKIEGQFSLQVLRIAPFPEDLITLGSDRIRQVWLDANPRGRGYSRAGEILKYVRESIGIKDGVYVDCDSLQNTEGDLYHPDKEDKVRSEETSGGYQTSCTAGSTGSIAETKRQGHHSRPCWISEESEIEQGSGKGT